MLPQMDAFFFICANCRFIDAHCHSIGRILVSTEFAAFSANEMAF